LHKFKLREIMNWGKIYTCGIFSFRFSTVVQSSRVYMSRVDIHKVFIHSQAHTFFIGPLVLLFSSSLHSMGWSRFTADSCFPSSSYIYDALPSNQLERKNNFPLRENIFSRKNTHPYIKLLVGAVYFVDKCYECVCIYANFLVFRFKI
jgi:hypothetical protein